MFDKIKYDRNITSNVDNEIGRVPEWDPNVRGRARLFLFKNREINNVAVRPYTYSHNTDFIDVATEAVNEGLAKYDNARMSLDKLYLENARGVDLIKTNKDGFLFNANIDKITNEMWTFLLVIDNADLVGRSLAKPLSNRLIYSGFVHDPVAKSSGIYSRNHRKLPRNPDALFHITSYTKTNMGLVRGSDGPRLTARPEIVADVIHHGLIGDTSNGRYTLARPADLIPAISPSSYTSYDDAYHVEEAVSIGNDLHADRKGITTILSNFGNPRTHGSNILSAMVQTAQNINSSEFIGAGCVPNNSRFADTRDMFAENLQMVHSTLPVGLDTNRLYTFAELMNLFPSLKDTPATEANVQAFSGVRTQVFTETDGMDPTPINIATTLIQQSISSIIKNCGLLDIGFKYSTAIPDMYLGALNYVGDGEIPYDIELLYVPVSSVVADDVDASLRRGKICIDNIRKQIFSIVQEIYGNFEVIINFVSGNDCTINLQLSEFTDSVNEYTLAWNDLFTSLVNPAVVDERTAIGNNKFLEEAAVLPRHIAEGFIHRHINNVSDQYDDFGDIHRPIDRSYYGGDEYTVISPSLLEDTIKY